MQPFVVPLVLLAIATVAVLAGNYVTRSFRMPDTGWKVSLIIAVLGVAAVILWTSWPPKQGIDLKGGVILIYQVDETLTQQVARRRQANDTEDPPEAQAEREGFGKVDMPALIQALSRRINPGGVQEIVVRRYGQDQVEIIIPDVASQEVERVKKLITTGGFLKFMIVANQRDHELTWNLADEPQQVGQYEIKNEQGNVVGQWVKLSLDPEASREDEPVYRIDPPGAKTRMVRGRKEILMVVDPNFDLQGSHLASVRKGFKDVSPCVYFDMTVRGAQLMGGLTATNLPDPNTGHYSLLGIVMDGELISAPRINETITSSGIIEGRFTDEEVDLLVNVLRAGRLPAVLRENPISQNEISPLLGNDTIRQGKVAITVSLVAVLVFMLIYYHFAGIVACLALLSNLMLILAMMIFVGAAFSLPGMAGLVLTVGMAVDANVLIFERIREELRGGAALRMAIRNGFGRATRTIVDANVTTLITAIVLYLIGNEQLRAFAVTLILGIMMCLFTAIFCSRAVFDIAERRRWIKKLTMLQLLATPNLNLFNLRRPAAILSLVAILVGLGAVYQRGQQIFDIDFVGGTSVQMLLRPEHAMPIAEVRTRVEKLEEFVPDQSVTEIRSEDPQRKECIYRIDTSRPPEEEGTQLPIEGSLIENVQHALTQIFRDDQGNPMLQTHSMQYTPPVPPTAMPEPTVVPPAADAPFLPGEPTQPQDDTEVVPAAQAEVEAGSFDEGRDASPSEPANGDPTTEPATDAPTDETPTDETPTDETPTDETPTDETAPADDQGALDRSLDGTLLAYAGDALWAQLPPQSEPPAPTVEIPSPGTVDSPLAPTGVPATTPSEPASSTPAAVEAGLLRAQAELTFDEKLNAETLGELIKETARELKFTEPDLVFKNEEEGWDDRSSQPFEKWTVQLSSPPEEATQIFQRLGTRLSETPVWLAADEIGGQVAGNKTRQALFAVAASLVGIIAYLWVRFQHVYYGVAAVVAVIHDVLITIVAIAVSFWLKDVLGFLQVEEFKISLPVVAAILTIIGYSLNDTIVIFDRIREVKGKSPHLTEEMINSSINQTLSRTVLTSLTTLIVVAILYSIGGQGIHAFAFCLIIGVIVGTYSTIFIASPVLFWLGGDAAKSPTATRERVTAAR